jgi:uncharacterized Ntn-hydrolase superfamily protein
MSQFKNIFLMLTLLLALTLNAKATWSIIVIDPKTNEIGIAGASCTFSVYGIGGIIPGKGAIVVQAMSNKAARNKGLQMILADASPQEILKAIRNPEFDPEQQQYGIVCLNAMNNPQTYTGIETDSAKGTATSKGISIQGNTLTNNKVFNKILQAAIAAQKASMSIQDILMIALEAGAEYGGDKRCGNRKASSAFLTVAKPGDAPQHPSLNLIYNQQDETTNAVKGLRRKFEEWKRINSHL